MSQFQQLVNQLEGEITVFDGAGRQPYGQAALKNPRTGASVRPTLCRLFLPKPPKILLDRSERVSVLGKGTAEDAGIRLEGAGMGYEKIQVCPRGGLLQIF